MRGGGAFGRRRVWARAEQACVAPHALARDRTHARKRMRAPHTLLRDPTERRRSSSPPPLPLPARALSKQRAPPTLWAADLLPDAGCHVNHRRRVEPRRPHCLDVRAGEVGGLAGFGAGGAWRAGGRAGRLAGVERGRGRAVPCRGSCLAGVLSSRGGCALPCSGEKRGQTLPNCCGKVRPEPSPKLPKQARKRKTHLFRS